MPLHFDGENIGVLCIGDNKPRDFDDDKISALSEAQVALASSHEELEMKSRIDILTHLWNRGAIMELTEAEWMRANGSDTAVLLIDIDHFKRINDTYGHPAGDQVLRVVAERLRAGMRPTDAIGRYGGEEFLAVLSNVGMDEMLQVSERIRSEVSNTAVLFDDLEIPVTCSIGGAISAPTDDVGALIRHADQALYRAKSTGRNRVEV